MEIVIEEFISNKSQAVVAGSDLAKLEVGDNLYINKPTKAFDTTDHRKTYKDWIYLGTCNGEDMYLESLPTEDIPEPKAHIVFGPASTQRITVRMPVSDMLDDAKCSKNIGQYLYTYNNSAIHLIASVREYEQKQLFKVKDDIKVSDVLQMLIESW